MLNRCLVSLTAAATSATFVVLGTTADCPGFPEESPGTVQATAISDLGHENRGLEHLVREWLGPPAGVMAQPRWLPGQNRFADQDGDLLPDSIEHVLLLDPREEDSDGDGIDDFLHAAAGFYASINNQPATGTLPADHLLRAVNTIEDDASGGTAVWTHLLFRVVGGDLNEVRALDLYLDHWGSRISLLPLVQTGQIDLAASPRPSGDLWLRVSMRLMAEQELQPLMPCTIGAAAVLGQRAVNTGGYIQSIDGASCALVATGSDSGVLQLMRRPEVDDPFWSTNRICVLRLLIVGSTTGGIYAEVARADCVVGRTTTLCPPTCTQSVGRLVFFPDGLRTVTGGGD